ncbi:MAG: phosphatase PAP2 family protein [Bacteroidota bacterium]|nr:phosphatase PAP2 family protein [Bacteroidota bacterium]
MTLPQLYRENRYFFIGVLIFLLASFSVFIFFSKAEGFILLNPYHTNFLNFVFIPLTYLGDGFFCVAVGLLLFFLKKRFLSLMVLSSYAISGIIAQVLKGYIVEARPAVYLKDTTYQYFIENVTLHNFHAFPSGHTASAFALAAVLSFGVTNKKYSMLFLAGAILVGYSRIYLAQHFIDDVLAGAIIGILSAIFCRIFFEKLFHKLLLPKKKI